MRKVYEKHTKAYENYMKTIQKQQDINRKSIGVPSDFHKTNIRKS